MAGVYARGNWCRVEYQGRKWQVKLAHTPANILALERQRAAIPGRLAGGETLDGIIAEMQGRREASNTLGYYAQHYLDLVAPERVTESTLMGYESAYNSHWLPFDRRPIDKLPLTELQRHLAAKDLTKKTRRNAISVIRLIFACAVPEVFQVNPLDGWTVPKSKRDAEPEPDPYTLEERDLLLGWLRENSVIAWRYFLHGFYTGMRTGELLGAPWEHVELPYQRIEVSMVRRKIQPHTKTKARRIYLAGEVRKMLASNPTRFQRGLIHLTPEGLQFKDADWLMRSWDKAHQQTHVRRRTGPYPWRHTFISHLLSTGKVSIEEVARWAGNSPGMISKHYGRYMPRQATEDRHAAIIEEAMK